MQIPNICKQQTGDDVASYTHPGSIYSKLNMLWWALAIAILFRLFTEQYSLIFLFFGRIDPVLVGYISFGFIIFTAQSYVSLRFCRAIIGLFTAVVIMFSGFAELPIFSRLGLLYSGSFNIGAVIIASVFLSVVCIAIYTRSYRHLYFILIHFIISILTVIFIFIAMGMFLGGNSGGHMSALTLSTILYPVQLLGLYFGTSITSMILYLVLRARQSTKYKYVIATSIVAVLLGCIMLVEYMTTDNLAIINNDVWEFLSALLLSAMLAGYVVILIASRYLTILNSSVINNIVKPALLGVIIISMVVTIPGALRIFPTLHFDNVMLYSK